MVMEKPVTRVNWVGNPMREGEDYHGGGEVEREKVKLWGKGEDPISRMRKYNPEGYKEFVRKRSEAIRASWERKRVLGIRRKKVEKK
jgi:hypothetical protein